MSDLIKPADIGAPSRSRPKRRPAGEKLIWIIAALSLAVVLLIGNARLIGGKTAPIWDAWAFYGAEFSLVADHARAGHFLLWDPWVNGGTPDHADPTVGAASPILIFVAAISGGAQPGFVAYWLVVWFLGPLGLLLLGRHLGAPAWGAFVVAAGFAFCGFYTGHAEHTSFVYSYSFLPWFIWRLDKALASKRLFPALQAGALWGISALGGYPQLTFLSACFLCLWALGRCWFSEPGDNGWSRPQFNFAILSLVLVFAVGTLVLAPSYVGLLTEGAGFTDRAGPLPRAYAISSNELDSGTLLTFASPYLHLLKYPGLNPTLWPKADVSVMGNYIGALPLIFALMAVVMRPNSGWRWWLVAIAAFAIMCGMGDHLPVRGWLYDFVPPTRYFRHAGAFRGYAIFGAAVLALAGTRDLQLALVSSLPRIWKSLVIISAIAAITAFSAYHHVISLGLRLAAGPRRANQHLMLVWAGSFLIFLVLLILPRKRKAAPILLCLLALIDVFYTARISQPLISDASFFLPLWTRADANHRPALALPNLERQLAAPKWLGPARNNNNILPKIPTLLNDATMANVFQIGFAMHPLLSTVATGSNRIWFTEKAADVLPSGVSFNDFMKRIGVLGAPVVVLHQPEEMVRMRPGYAASSQDSLKNTLAISDLPPAHQVPVDLIAYEPNQLKFDVQCPGDGWLLVTDRWSRDWRATVNESPVPVLGGDFVFRAIPVRAGENRVQFFYRPFGWWELLLLSWGTLFIIFAGPRIRALCRTPT